MDTSRLCRNCGADRAVWVWKGRLLCFDCYHREFTDATP